MPEAPLFLSSRTLDEATLVAASEVATLPVTNLQTLEPQRKWRSVGLTSQYIAVTLASAAACNTLALVAGNFTTSATARVRAATLEANLTSAPDLDTGEVIVWPATGKPSLVDWPVFTCLVRWENSTAYRYWRVDFADSANPDGYLELGRMMLGVAFRPASPPDYEIALALVPPDQVTRTPFGRTFSDNRGAAPRRLILPFSAVSHSDLTASFFELQRYCGLARDFVFSLDPSATTDFHLYTLQALFASGAAFEAQPLWDSVSSLWRCSLAIEEPL